MSSIKLFLTADSFSKAILAMKTQAAKLDDAVQMVLASSVFHAVKSGNVNPVNETMMAMSRGQRKQAISAWLLAYAPVVPNTDPKTNKDQPFRFSKDKLIEIAEKHDFSDMKKITEEEAQGYAEAVYLNLWTDHKEPPLVPATFDVAAAIVKVIKQAEGYAGKTTKVIGGDMLEMLKRLTAAKVDHETPAAL